MRLPVRHERRVREALDAVVLGPVICMTRSGVRKHVVQFTTVVPPTARPWRIAML
jgi:hypothetical protein